MEAGGVVYLCQETNVESLSTEPPVYLEKPWLQLVVQQNIKPENLEAGRAVSVGGETRAIVVPQNRMSCHQCLDYDILMMGTQSGGGGGDQGEQTSMPAHICLVS